MIERREEKSRADPINDNLKMNIFRITADALHFLAIVSLLLQIWKTKSSANISGKSQILYATVYLTRYVDLFTDFISVYNSVMKVLFIGGTYTIIYLIFSKFSDTYDRENDAFRIGFLLLPAIALAMLVNHQFTQVEILWTFSIYLEAVAIVPQLFMVWRTGTLDNVKYYLMAMGSYRALYLMNWVWRYIMEGRYDLITVSGGIVHTYLYCSFFVWYNTRVPKAGKIQCPKGEIQIYTTFMDERKDKDISSHSIEEKRTLDHLDTVVNDELHPITGDKN